MKLKQEPIGIGQNLRKLRQDAGYSQSQVAAILCERGVYMTTDIYKRSSRTNTTSASAS